MPIPTSLSTTETPSNSSTSAPDPTTDSEVPTSGISQSLTNEEVKTKTEAEEAADRLYEERIEEEYAKREGGA